jgi:hypothetical protein
VLDIWHKSHNFRDNLDVSQFVSSLEHYPLYLPLSLSLHTRKLWERKLTYLGVDDGDKILLITEAIHSM